MNISITNKEMSKQKKNSNIIEGKITLFSFSILLKERGMVPIYTYVYIWYIRISGPLSLYAIIFF